MAHRDIQIEVFVQISDSSLEVALKLAVVQARDVQRAYSRQKKLSIAIHRHMCVEVDLSPYSNHELIPRTDNVIGGNGRLGNGSEGSWNLIEELSAVDGHGRAFRIFGKPLEFGLRCDWANRSRLRHGSGGCRRMRGTRLAGYLPSCSRRGKDHPGRFLCCPGSRNECRGGRTLGAKRIGDRAAAGRTYVAAGKTRRRWSLSGANCDGHHKSECKFGNHRE